MTPEREAEIRSWVKRTSRATITDYARDLLAELDRVRAERDALLSVLNDDCSVVIDTESAMWIRNRRAERAEAALRQQTERACRFNCDADGSGCTCAAHVEYHAALTGSEPAPEDKEKP